MISWFLCFFFFTFYHHHPSLSLSRKVKTENTLHTFSAHSINTTSLLSLSPRFPLSFSLSLSLSLSLRVFVTLFLVEYRHTERFSDLGFGQGNLKKQRVSSFGSLAYTTMSVFKDEDPRIHGIKTKIRVVPNFPKPGLFFFFLSSKIWCYLSFSFSFLTQQVVLKNVVSLSWKPDYVAWLKWVFIFSAKSDGLCDKNENFHFWVSFHFPSIFHT